MSLSQWRMAVRAGLSVLGLCLVAAAVFAQRLGLDSNAAWGPSRRLLLVVGLAIVGVVWLAPAIRSSKRAVESAAWVQRFQTFLRSAEAGWDRRVSESAILRRWRMWLASLAKAGRWLVSSSRPLRWLGADSYRVGWAVLVIFWVAAVLLLVWIATVGTWHTIPQTTSDFDLLARGFLEGHLHLPIQPSAKFLSLPDPYAQEARRYMPQIWDVTYYQGHFYLYWGPVPALFALAWRVISGGGVGDDILTLLFVASTLLATGASALYLWKTAFRSGGFLVLLPPILAILFSAPALWLATRPAVYEAAIASGQAFLILGFFLLLPTFIGERAPKWRMALGGLCLALAVGSRVNLLPAAVFLVVAASLVEWTASRKMQLPGYRRLLALMGPFLMVGMVWAGYNQARFGSVLENGHSYQLGRVAGVKSVFGILSLGNVVPNLFNYLLNGIQTLPVFPYLKATWGAYYIWPAHYYAPQGYYTEQISGLLWAVPFIWLVVIWGGRKLGRRFSGSNASVTMALPDSLASLGATQWVLVGTCILLFLPLLTFRTASMRYQFDVMPSLLILTSIGFWALHDRRLKEGSKGSPLLELAFALAIATVLEGVLLAMTGFGSRFEHLNPALFQQLTRWFTW
jgi:hypothetical protein